MQRLLATLFALCATTAVGATLDRIEVASDHGVVVRLHCSAPVTAQTQTLPARLGFLNRIAVDLPGTRLGTGARGVTGGRGPLLRVLTEQLDARTVRVELDLDDEVTFSVGGHGSIVEIRLAAPSAAPATPPTVPGVRQPPL